MIRPHNVIILKVLAFAIVLLSILYILALKYIDTFASGPTNAFDIADLNEPISAYDNGKIYSVGSIVKLNGNIYKMVEGIGAAGYSPERPGDKSWSKINKYDNSVVYTVGNVVDVNGAIYKMVEAIGASGYSPERPGDKSWQRVKTTSKMSNTFNYRAPWYVQ